MGLRGGKKGVGKYYITSGLVLCTPHHTLFYDQIKNNEVALWGTGEVHVEFWFGDDGKRHLEDLGVDGKII